MSGIARFITILSVASTLSFAAGHAGADALVLAGAQFNWNSLSITSDPGVSLVFRTPDYLSSISVNASSSSNPSVSQSQSAASWTAPISAYSSGASYGSASMGEWPPYNEANFYALGVSGTPDTWGNVSSSAYRYGVFDVSGSGLVTLAIGYSAMVGGGADPGYLGNGIAEALIRLGELGGLADEKMERILVSVNPSAPLGASNANGILTASMQFNDGDVGYMNFMTYAEASHTMISQQPAVVPEPGSLLLLLGGIAGLRLGRRRMQRSV